MKRPDFSDLTGKVAVLTGGTGAIGTALARALALWGARVAVGGRDAERSRRAAAELSEQTGHDVLGLAFDVLDRGSLVTALARLEGHWGPPDLLINAAGGNRPAATTGRERLDTGSAVPGEGTFYDLDLAAVGAVMDLNVQGTLLPTQVFTRPMVGRGGVVLNLSSMSSLRALTKVPAYSASKAAVNNLTQWLAVHLAPAGIRVNALAPGFFLTDQNRFLLTDEQTGAPSPRARSILASTPWGRLGAVDDLVGAALFLCSDLSRFVTGALVPVDGGFSAFGGV